jgi:hypothetical protein
LSTSSKERPFEVPSPEIERLHPSALLPPCPGGMIITPEASGPVNFLFLFSYALPSALLKLSRAISSGVLSLS